MSSSSAPIVSAGLLAPLPTAERGVAAVLHASGDLLCYGAGSVVVVRSLASPELALAYCEHGARVKVARIAPSGKYVASGDAAGRVRVWALTGGGFGLKYELPSIGGEVEDLAWDGESKRLLAVGGGQAKAKFFAWDTGSSLGEVVPHSKKNVTCDLRQQRPLRAVLGGEDFSLSFYAGGPPFKYERALKEHSNFVNCVRYAPDGGRFLSVSSDKAGVVYNGETAAVVGKLDAAAGHAGGVYSAAWAADSSRAVTCGGDKTVRLWDMAADAGGKFPCLATFTLGKAVEDMQMAVVWPAPELVVSLSLVRRGGGRRRPVARARARARAGPMRNRRARTSPRAFAAVWFSHMLSHAHAHAPRRAAPLLAAPFSRRTARSTTSSRRRRPRASRRCGA